MSERILIVEDEQPIIDLLRLVLEREGLVDIAEANTVAEALASAKASSPALILLDVMLPDGDGFTLATHLREFTSAPILFLTARSGDLEKLTGFGVGGDDYVTKPFNPLEVVARIKAHLRRSAVSILAPDENATEVFDWGGFRLSEAEGVLEVDGRAVAIPAREFQLLTYLCRNPGRVFSKRQLYRLVWGEESLGESDDNTVQVHIHRLREKIEPRPGQPQYLVTMRGLGYKLLPPETGAR
ncbi:MAG: DNA-binding response regulator [Actinobacteria bacterium HGW-Actinobacteria-6]|nr:MAG: DNA-binding response regulator [Actinobacteria bacterium HGW-Actinobacteria-6]